MKKESIDTLRTFKAILAEEMKDPEFARLFEIERKRMRAEYDKILRKEEEKKQRRASKITKIAVL